MLVTYEEINEIINSDKIKENVIIDTRNKDSFEHMNIPGSINLPYKSFLNYDNTFKTNEEMLEIIESKGIKGDKNVINYCGIGLTASINSFIFHELLELENIKLYSGSMEEYSHKI